MINVSVIGLGYWGPNLIRNFVANPQTNIEACCDLRSDRLKYISKIYPSIKTTSDYRELIKDPETDIVAVITPVNTHFEIARAALLQGKHVLLAKPMTSSTTEAEELINIAERKSLKLFVDHTFLFTGAVRKIKELIDSHEIGDLYYFDSVRINLGLLQHDVNVLWDLAPHDISIMLYLMEQKPDSITATGADHFGKGLEDVAYLTVFFPNNLIAHIHVNWLSPVKIRETLIAGNKKMVVWDDNLPSEKIRIYDKGIEVIDTPDQVYQSLVQYRTGDMYCPKIDNREALSVQIDEIVKALEMNDRHVSDGHLGLTVVKILESAQKSIKDRGIEIKIS